MSRAHSFPRCYRFGRELGIKRSFVLKDDGLYYTSTVVPVNFCELDVTVDVHGWFYVSLAFRLWSSAIKA